MKQVLAPLILAFALLHAAPALCDPSEAPTSAAEADAVTGIVAKASAAFATGDMTTLRTVMTRDLVIVDEMAPYTWSGPDALDVWAGALTAFEKRAGRSNSAFATGAVRSVRRTDTHAYVVSDATYDFDQDGKRWRERGVNAWTLVMAADGWKITGWTWTLMSTEPLGTK